MDNEYYGHGIRHWLGDIGFKQYCMHIYMYISAYILYSKNNDQHKIILNSLFI